MGCNKADGQPRRMLDVSRAEKEFGFRAKVEFEEGVEEFGLGVLALLRSSHNFHPR